MGLLDYLNKVKLSGNIIVYKFLLSFIEKYCVLDGWLEDYKNELDLIKETIDKG